MTSRTKNILSPNYDFKRKFFTFLWDGRRLYNPNKQKVSSNSNFGVFSLIRNGIKKWREYKALKKALKNRKNSNQSSGVPAPGDNGEGG